MSDLCGVDQVGEIRIRIPNDLHKALKQLAIDRGITLKKLITDILEDYITNTKKGER